MTLTQKQIRLIRKDIVTYTRSKHGLNNGEVAFILNLGITKEGVRKILSVKPKSKAK